MQCQEWEHLFEQAGGDPLPAGAQSHLESCGRCRALVADLDRMETAARELPKELDPPERLWTSLRAQLVTEGLIRDEARVVSPGWLGLLRELIHRPSLAFAAASLVALGALLFVLRPAPTSLPASTFTAEQPALVQAGMALRKEETGTVASHAAHASPVDASLRRNLEIVDNFIAACEERVQAEPGNEVAREYLSGAYQQKAELLSAMLDRTASGD